MNTNYAKRVSNAKKISSKYESKLKWGVKNYNPIPGHFLHGLNNTKELLKNYNSEQHFPVIDIEEISILEWNVFIY